MSESAPFDVMRNYVENACKTEVHPEQVMLQRNQETLTQQQYEIRLLHGAMGICTEAGELQDALKKHIFYGAPLDETNLVEELGDLLWYVAILCDSLQVPLHEVMDKNIRKLKARYPDKFTPEDALNRNLQTERGELES